MEPTTDLPHILVMEDEAIIRTLIVKTLRKRGYDVTETPEGKAAVAAFAELPEETKAKCILILDLMVPSGMGGKETLSEIRKLAPTVKAIIASGLSDENEIDELRKPGLTGILTKPYNIRDLEAAIADVR